MQKRNSHINTDMARNGCECLLQESTTAKIPKERYQQIFEPSQYLKFLEDSFPSKAWPRHSLQCYHESFSDIPSGVRVLDFGAGPVILSTISAATKASEIVLADYSEFNLKSLQQWLRDDCPDFDWSPYFRYVVQELEGEGEGAVKEREGNARDLVTSVVHCDITQDPPIERGYDGPYDVVVCSLVLEGASNSREEYRCNAARLAKLVKPGGYLFYYGIDNKNGYYTFGDHCLPNLHFCNHCLLCAFKDAGFSDPIIQLAPTDDEKRQYRFIRCKRS